MAVMMKLALPVMEDHCAMYVWYDRQLIRPRACNTDSVETAKIGFPTLEVVRSVVR